MFGGFFSSTRSDTRQQSTHSERALCVRQTSSTEKRRESATGSSGGFGGGPSGIQYQFNAHTHTQRRARSAARAVGHTIHPMAPSRTRPSYDTHTQRGSSVRSALALLGPIRLRGECRAAVDCHNFGARFVQGVHTNIVLRQKHGGRHRPCRTAPNCLHCFFLLSTHFLSLSFGSLHPRNRCRCAPSKGASFLRAAQSPKQQEKQDKKKFPTEADGPLCARFAGKRTDATCTHRWPTQTQP